ncbi:MAG: hypothetical protein ACXWKY_06115 [Caulobacteraceae bacterium]
MHIAVLGRGHIGATSMARLAKLGHAVMGVDVSDRASSSRAAIETAPQVAPACIVRTA